MTTPPIDVDFVPADAKHRAQGLLGWAKLSSGALVVDGVTLRRTLDQRLVVTWPRRTAQDGRRYPVAAATNTTTLLAVEAAVVAAWRQIEGAAP
ncbi:MAG: hypothetical protein H6697_12705 [Myxococcales bacterium]|nr:hypothetical protein [Myxococcales bacterium]